MKMKEFGPRGNVPSVPTLNPPMNRGHPKTITRQSPQKLEMMEFLRGV